MNLQEWEALLQRPGVRQFGWIAAGLVAAVVILGSDLVSYLQSTTSTLENKIHAAVPLEFEIERAQALVNALMPGIRREMMQVAEQQVSLGDLQKLVALEADTVQTDRETLRRMRNDPDNKSATFMIAGQPASAGQLRREMERRLSLLKMSEDRLTLHRSQMEIRQRELDRLLVSVQEMLTKKDRLQVQLEELNSRVKSLSASENHESGIDDDKSSNECNAAIAALRARLDAADRLLRTRENLQQMLEESYVSGIQVQSDITTQIDEHFGVQSASPTDSVVNSPGETKP